MGRQACLYILVALPGFLQPTPFASTASGKLVHARAGDQMRLPNCNSKILGEQMFLLIDKLANYMQARFEQVANGFKTSETLSAERTTS